MIVKNDLFDYGLSIYQNSEYFKFSLDSILLGEFVTLKRKNRVLDLCTGNAPIPLILYSKDNSIKVDCLEIQEEIYLLAKKSIEENSLEGSIRIIHGDAKYYEDLEKYDVVTCNPPYFKVTDTSEKNKNEVKRIARHEVCITLSEVVCSAKKNLKETGLFYLVERVDRFLETIKLVDENKMGIRKICFIYTKSDKPAEFFLLEASNYKKSDPKIYSVYTENRATYKNIFEEV